MEPRRPTPTSSRPGPRDWLRTTAFLLLPILVACGGSDRRLHRDFPAILFVTIDTLNVRFVGPHNPEVTSTPTLDRFAAEGVAFDHAYTTVPITLPAHTTLFSGRTPENVGVMANGDLVPLEVETLAEILRDRGYRTAAFPSLGVLKPQFGLGQGFDHYDAFEEEDPFRRSYRRAPDVVDAGLGWIREAVPAPLFVWIHISDPHEPYQSWEPEEDVELWLDETPIGRYPLASKKNFRIELEVSSGVHRLRWRSLRPPRPDDLGKTALTLDRLAVEYRSPPPDPTPLVLDGLEGQATLRPEWETELRNRTSGPVTATLHFRGKIAHPPRSEVTEKYRLEVALVDRELGRLRRELEELGLDRGALWVVVSDHGEGLYDHRVLGHAAATYEDQLRMLWLLRGPGVEPGVRIDAGPVLHQDVLPTLLDLLGLPVSSAVEGRSLRGCWSGGPCATRETWRAYGMQHEEERITSVARYLWPYKGISHWKRRSGIYDLESDPQEWRRLRFEQIEREEARSLGRVAKGELEELRRILARRPGKAELDDTSREALEALGYL